MGGTHDHRDTNGTPNDVGALRRAIVLLNVSNADTDAGDTLDVFVDVLGPDGATWLNAIHFPQVIGTAAACKAFAVLDSDNPGALAIAVTADAAPSAVRPALFGSQCEPAGRSWTLTPIARSLRRLRRC